MVKINVDFEINVLEKSGVTLKKPSQSLVGVSLAENNFFQGEKMTTHVIDVRVQDEEDLQAELITPRASTHDSMVEIFGEMVYQATLLKLTASNPLSRD